MRIWDIPCQSLCNKHLLGEHRELHCIWTFLTTNKGESYKKHPETLRWAGKLEALLLRHSEQCIEMFNRGWKHKSLLNISDIKLGLKIQDKFVNTIEEQIEILKLKKCNCKI